MSHTKTNQTQSLYNSTNVFIVRNGMEAMRLHIKFTLSESCFIYLSTIKTKNFMTK